MQNKNKLQLFKEAKKPWKLDEALEFLRELIPILRQAGWAVGLTGSVLEKGKSDNDLDIILYPLDNNCIVIEKAKQALIDSGMQNIFSAAEIHKFWERAGSMDVKHVEVWEYNQHRIDVFFLN